MAMLVVGYFCVSSVHVRAVCCHGAEQEACVCTSAVVYIAPLNALADVCGHITMVQIPQLCALRKKMQKKSKKYAAFSPYFRV